MKIICAIFVMLLIAGCAGLGQSNLSAEQLKELAKDKSIGVMTTEVNGIWGVLRNKVITVDQKVLIDGTVTVAPDGAVVITNRVPPAVPRPVPNAGGAALIQVPVLVQGVPVSTVPQ